MFMKLYKWICEAIIFWLRLSLLKVSDYSNTALSDVLINYDANMNQLLNVNDQTYFLKKYYYTSSQKDWGVFFTKIMAW